MRLSETTNWGYRFPHTSYWGWSRWKEAPRLNREKETLTEKKAEEISTNAEGKCRNLKRRQKRYQGKCRSRQNQNWRQKGDQDQRRKNRAQSTAVCVGLICRGSVWNSGLYEGGAYHRIRVETTEVLRREYEAKSNGCRDGKPNIGSKTRNANMIQKVEGSRRNCHGSS